MNVNINSLRAAILAVAVFALIIAAAPRAHAADLPMPQAVEHAIPTLSANGYLDRYADLLLLRLRFAAVPENEVAAQMRAAAESLGGASPSRAQREALRDALTSELNYYVVTLKYLIWTEGAIWPTDKPEARYRSAALSELAAITGELARTSVLRLDVDALLHRLEMVNAWTEGLSKPAEDWFGPARREQLLKDAGSRGKGPTQT